MNYTPKRNILMRLIAMSVSSLPALTSFVMAQALKQDAATASPSDAGIPVITQSIAPSSNSEDVIMMSPFQVDATRDKGYYAENTLAGSRMKTNIADLASSISVVTKQQLEDTASMDINDIFRYEAGTEGTHTFTSYTIDKNGGVSDVGAGYAPGGGGGTQTAATANRIRGLSAPDASRNFYSVSSRMPLDSYNTQSIEISRGPNSLLFGSGSPSGIVNQSTTDVDLRKQRFKVQFQVDSNSSTRVTLSANVPLVKNTLGFYVAALYDDKQFERKPSYDITRRQYGAISFKPFKTTLIKANVENYNNANRRPNTVTPRDGVTTWLDSGMPAYDPVSGTITKLATGEVVGPFVSSTTSANYVASINQTPAYWTAKYAADGRPNVNMFANGGDALNSVNSYWHIPGIVFQSGLSRPLMRVANGSLVDYWARQPSTVSSNNVQYPSTAYPTQATITADPAMQAMYERRWTASSLPTAPTQYSSYYAPGVTNKDIYDWEHVNTIQANHGTVKGATYNVEFEQQILRDLFFSAGWLRQDLDYKDSYTISQQSGAILFIDTNYRLPNGELNPYFGLPYVEDSAPDTFTGSELRDNYRAMLSFTPDFTQNKGWTKWLGKYRFLGMWAKERVTTSMKRHRGTLTSADNYDGNLRYLPNKANAKGWRYADTTIRRSFYLANPGDPYGKVTQGTGSFGNPGTSSADIMTYNWATGQFEADTVGLETVMMHDSSGQKFREIESWNLGMQANLLDDRIAVTVGWRRDKYKARSTTTGIISDQDGNMLEPAISSNKGLLYPNGYANEDLIMNRWNQQWDKLNAETTTTGVVVRPFKDVWSKISIAAERGNVAAEFLNNISFHYNKSDNFNPPPDAKTDMYRRALPKPEGEGKDWGVSFNLFQNKLYARVNWYETVSYNERTNSASSYLGRMRAIDDNFMVPWATMIVRIQDTQPGELYPWELGYSNVTQPALTDAQLDRVWKMIGLPAKYYDGIDYAATQTNRSRGTELTVIYNPRSNWTIKFTGSRTKAMYNDVAPEGDSWLAKRLPYWKSATIPSGLPAEAYAVFGYNGETVTNNPSGSDYYIGDFWNSFGYKSEIKLNNSGDKTLKEYYTTTVEGQIAMAKALQGLPSPSLRRYQAALTTNYNFDKGSLKGFSIGGSLRYESKAAIGYYGKEGDPDRPGIITMSDVNQPIYDKENYYTDLWVAYRTKILGGKVSMKIQLNVYDVFEDGGLRTIGVNWDGSPYAYRIVDSRKFILSTTFDF
ncbi:outer membrane receptor protein involved in Fe transport [Ereboglobus sp. PH5-10]|uniref:TonB-dependent receptor n=1 Tax=Ereboglobus sp. PH5-10 TaxID=2940629 RepID=UPI002406349B|nr:TonB-dependent receptor [Ereboglobus sp. PH5-10]MDF9827910.1 outer membrane receptor protein involved in Fe transport [Ereboglobus sp. PH5-10]